MRSPGGKGGGGQDTPKLNLQVHKPNRTMAARLNFMAQDSPAMQFPAKEVCRHMADPCTEDFGKIKRLVRFIAGVKTKKWEIPWQIEQEALVLRVYADDSDWDGCHRTRRSTTGGLVCLGRHPLKTWSVTHVVVVFG